MFSHDSPNIYFIFLILPLNLNLNLLLNFLWLNHPPDPQKPLSSSPSSIERPSPPLACTTSFSSVDIVTARRNPTAWNAIPSFASSLLIAEKAFDAFHFLCTCVTLKSCLIYCHLYSYITFFPNIFS